MILPDPVLVDTDAALARLCDHCRHLPAIAVDTEFMRTDTFYPIVGLLQVSDGDNVWLVDPLAVEDVSPWVTLLSDPAVIKVFHSCSEDLEVLSGSYGVVPEPLFDTQIAAGMLGYGFSRGYAKLVNDVLELQLDKHETRSDWLQRPLSAAQCRYAAEDVYYLMKVYQVLADSLDSKGRMAWLQQEMAELVASARTPVDPDLYYRRIKGAWKLSASGLGLLKVMASWREREARASDRPRGHIVPDKVLLEVARLRPTDRQGLSRIEGMHPRILRRYGESLLALINDSAVEAVESLPEPLPREARQILSDCRALVEQRAEELDMAPELLVRRRDLEALVRGKLVGNIELPPALAEGWRRQVIGEELYNHVR